MYSVKQDMNLRLDEAKGLIDFIASAESGQVSAPVRLNSPVLRASVVLSLYNIIESTISQSLTYIHDEINSSRTSYNNLTKEIRNLILVYFYRHKDKNNDVHNSLEVLHKTVDLIRGKGCFYLPYDVMSESYQLYSGNLDAKSIRKVMLKYGIFVSDDYGRKLVRIKNGRNTLAHGNLSFEEYGRDVVVTALKEYLFDVSSFLNEVISKVDEFTTQKKYKVSKKKKRR